MSIKLVAENYSKLAELIVKTHYQTNPKLEKAYGPEGHQKCIDDAIIHLTYLQQALDNQSESLFVDYILWAKTLFEGINLPISHLKEHLKVMGDVLRQQLDQDSAGKSGQILLAAEAAISGESKQIKSFLDEDNPHYKLAKEYLDFLMASDRNAASQLILKAVKEHHTPIQQIYLHVFQPCQREVGLLWQTGRLSVAQEHFCTAATQLCMSQLYPYIFGNDKNGKVSVITCAQGELHEIGVRMVADLLEMNGWDAFYLGANVPIRSVISFVAEKQPDMVGISATITSHLPQVKTLIEEIREIQQKPICIMVGGYPFNVSETLYQELGADAQSSDAQTAIDTANNLAQVD